MNVHCEKLTGRKSRRKLGEDARQKKDRRNVMRTEWEEDWKGELKEKLVSEEKRR